jgi:hypothetical protein
MQQFFRQHSIRPDRPNYRLLRGEPVKQAEDLAELRAKAEAGELVLLSQDEVRFPMVPTLTANLGVKGHRPTVGTQDCKHLLDVLTVINVVTAAVHANLPESPAKAKLETGKSKTRRMQEAFAAHLRHVARIYPADRHQRVVLILDNAPWQRGGPIDEALAESPHLEFYRLPSSSPHLKVIERFWRRLRRRATHNRLFKGLGDLKRSLRASRCDFQTVGVGSRAWSPPATPAPQIRKHQRVCESGLDHGGHEPRERGCPRQLAWSLRQPVGNPCHIDRRRHDVLVMAYQLPDVSQTAKSARPYPWEIVPSIPSRRLDLARHSSGTSRDRAACKGTYSSRGCTVMLRRFARVHRARAGHGPQSLAEDSILITAWCPRSTAGDQPVLIRPSGQLACSWSQSIMKSLAAKPSPARDCHSKSRRVGPMRSTPNSRRLSASNSAST